MAIARINGTMLYSDLERQGVDLAIDGNLFYFDVTNRRVGVNTTAPTVELHVLGNAKIADINIVGNTVTANSPINFGDIANVQIYGGSAGHVLYTDGSGNLAFGNLAYLTGIDGFTGNSIALGTNLSGTFSSNATQLSSTTTVTDSIAELNYVLGKLIPVQPPDFPNSNISITSTSYLGRMTNFVQTDNTPEQNKNITAGTSLYALRAPTFNTSAITNVGPGDHGTVTVYFNGVPNGNITLTGNNANTANGYLTVYNVEDYSQITSIAAGFWTVFSAEALSTSGVPAGWNEVYIYDSATNSRTNTPYWYYDASTPGTPTFSNTSIALTTNSVVYSSTVPHFTGSTQFTLKGNVNNLSGDLYYISDTFISGLAGGAFQSPASVTYSQAGVATPLARNQYVGSGSAYFESIANIVSTGFGISNGGPTLEAYNSYTVGTGGFSTGANVLYKNSNTTAIDELNILVSSNLGGGYSTNGERIANPGTGDTPAYTGTEAVFDSQTGPFYSYDATVVAAVLSYNTNNYSYGYLPSGPDLSSHNGTAQYFTFRFRRTVVSKFDVQLTGTVAGLWVALPGSSIDTTSTLNGWLDMSVAYAGSGTPGAGSGGNGSNGCALSGTVPKNTAIVNGSYTATFGPDSSSASTNNEIYVRIKLTQGQLLTALSIGTPTH